jgi:AcrR family transcriptional regulator
MTDMIRKEDRRKERTRQLLRDALMELIVEKGYEAINVNDITERANVARPTFYLHYKDKQELLFNSLREIYDDLAAREMDTIVAGLNQRNLDDMSDADFQHVAQHAAFYRTMLSDRGSVAFIIQMFRYLRGLMQTHALPPFQPDLPAGVPSAALAACMAGAQIGLVEWWLNENNMQATPQEMARIMHMFCLMGLNWDDPSQKVSS